MKKNSTRIISSILLTTSLVVTTVFADNITNFWQTVSYWNLILTEWYNSVNKTLVWVWAPGVQDWYICQSINKVLNCSLNPASLIPAPANPTPTPAPAPILCEPANISIDAWWRVCDINITLADKNPWFKFRWACWNHSWDNRNNLFVATCNNDSTWLISDIYQWWYYEHNEYQGWLWNPGSCTHILPHTNDWEWFEWGCVF